MKISKTNIYLNEIADRLEDDLYENEFKLNLTCLNQYYALTKLITQYLLSPVRTEYKKNKNRWSVYYSLSGKGESLAYNIFDNMDINQLFNLSVIVSIEINIKKFNVLRLKCFKIKTSNITLEGIISKNWDYFCEKQRINLLSIIDSINNLSYIQKSLLTNHFIKKYDFYGEFQFNHFNIDAGEKLTSNELSKQCGKNVEFIYKFPGIKVKNQLLNIDEEIDNSLLYFDIYSKLLQVFLCKPFNIKSNSSHYTSETLIDCKMKKICNYEDAKYYLKKDTILIIENIDELFDNFFSLDIKSQNIYYNACNEFIYALNSDQGIQSCFHLYAVIENLLKFENNSSQDKKKDNFIKFITRYINFTNIEQLYDDWNYLRCRYAHEGLTSFINIIFGEFKSIDEFSEQIKLIVFYVLIQWIQF